jgi:hypothetical protein
MTFTTKQIKDLNGSMSAAKSVRLGSLLGGVGFHTVTDPQGNASAVVLDTSASSITGWLVNVTTSGSVLSGGLYITGAGGSVLTIAGANASSASQAKLTYGDRISYFVF